VIRERVEKIFERFYTTGRIRTSARIPGLGLSISKQIVEAHGGRIWVENRPAAGDSRGRSRRRARAPASSCGCRRCDGGRRLRPCTPRRCWPCARRVDPRPRRAGKSKLALALIDAAQAGTAGVSPAWSETTASTSNRITGGSSYGRRRRSLD
jgi:hypothetical protein